MSTSAPQPPAPATLAPAPAASLHQRIKKVSISGYRAFPPYKPKSLEIDLGDTGKNLLLYGENGSGKTSLFRVLRDLFDTNTEIQTYEAHRNIFQQDEEDAIVVHFTSGNPPDFRWEVGEPHPKETGGDPFRDFSNSCVFLEYRDLLKTNFVHRSGTPNLFDLLVKLVLPELPTPTRPLREFHDAMRAAIPRGKQTKIPIRRANLRAQALVTALTNHLPELESEANRLLVQLQPKTAIKLTPPAGITYNKATRDYNGQVLALGIELDGKTITEPQHFLNEARLTAIALAIYLAAARLTRSTRPGIMVLDDVLIGLDVSNRLPLLRVLQTEFSDWQILLLTHDATWFDMAEERLDEAAWTFQRLHNVREPGTGRERPLHVMEESYLLRAEGFLLHGDFPAAGVYLRSTFEALLRNFAEDKRLAVPFKRELRELSSEDFWPGAKSWAQKKGGATLITDALADEIEFCRKFILNPLCHVALGRPNRSEVELALSALRQLKLTIESAKTWRADWEQKHPRGDALPTHWHMALCDWMIGKNPPIPTTDTAFAMRNAFAVGLDTYNERHRSTITYTADSYATIQIRWDAAKTVGLNAAQSGFVTLIESHSTWLLKDVPTDADWAAVTADNVKTAFDALRGTSTGQNIKCVLHTW